MDGNKLNVASSSAHVQDKARQENDLIFFKNCT
jgi:hypothetical protein